MSRTRDFFLSPFAVATSHSQGLFFGWGESEKSKGSTTPNRNTLNKETFKDSFEDGSRAIKAFAISDFFYCMFSLSHYYYIYC